MAKPQQVVNADGKVLNLCPHCDMWVYGKMRTHILRYCVVGRSGK